MPLSKTERDKLPDAAFGDPTRRLFPITSQEDVDAAARFIGVSQTINGGKSQDPEAIKRRILSICKRKRLTPPAAWTQDANMSVLPVTVEFSAAPGRLEGDWVVRKADVIFRADDYDFPAEKGGPFSMTPEEILAYCQDFQDPVELEDTHAPSLFNGKLGHLVEVSPSDDGSTFGGKIKVPTWLDRLFPNQPLPLSARWDRKTKTLKKVALVPNPRIGDAAAFSHALEVAFAEAQAEKEKPAIRVKGESTPDKDVPDKKVKSPHGQMKLQELHDLAARHGAVCHPKHSPGVLAGEAGSANFSAQHEMHGVQKVHDTTLEHGASCSLYKEPDYDDRDKKDPVMSTPEKTKREQELEAALFSEKEARQAAEQKALHAQAEAFAVQMIQEHRILPADKEDLVAEFCWAGQDDLQHARTVEFSDDQGHKRQGTRLDALKARYRKRTPHRYTKEEVPGEAVALFNDDSSTAQANQASKVRQVADQALLHTEIGRRIVAERNSKK